MHFVWLQTLTMLIDNPVSIFLVTSTIFSYNIFSNKYLWVSKILLISVGLKLAEKNYATPFSLFPY